jgi:hypothetical protein
MNANCRDRFLRVKYQNRVSKRTQINESKTSESSLKCVFPFPSICACSKQRFTYWFWVISTFRHNFCLQINFARSEYKISTIIPSCNVSVSVQTSSVKILDAGQGQAGERKTFRIMRAIHSSWNIVVTLAISLLLTTSSEDWSALVMQILQ